MAAPKPTSALDMDNPETDTRQAFEALGEAQQEQKDHAEKIPVHVNVDDAAVLKESEVAVPGMEIAEDSLAKRVYEAATTAREQPAVMHVSPQDAVKIQEAASRVVHAKESAEKAGTPTPQARIFP